VGAEARFDRTLVRWTICYWFAVYVLLTLRSITAGHPHLGTQAMLRVPMIAIGIGFCALIHVLLQRFDARTLEVRAFVALAASIVSTFAFSVAAYLLFVVLPGIWADEVGFVVTVSYFAFQILWIFPAWTLLRYYFQLRSEVALVPDEAGFIDEFWPKHLGRLVRVAAADIDWIEAEGDYVRLHAAGHSYLIRSTLGGIAARLDPAEFIRIHRRHIVARKAIVSMTRDHGGRLSIGLTNGTTVPAGRSYARGLKP